MRRPTLHFSRGWKILLYGFILLSLTTGSGWFVLDRWFTVVDEFDIAQKHPLQSVLLKIHAASAMFVMIGYGYLLATHVHAAWRTRRQRMSGVPLMACIAVLIASSYGLYYIGDETWRARVAWLHLGAGLSLPVLVILHLLGRKKHG